MWEVQSILYYPKSGQESTSSLQVHLTKAPLGHFQIETIGPPRFKYALALDKNKLNVVKMMNHVADPKSIGSEP